MQIDRVSSSRTSPKSGEECRSHGRYLDRRFRFIFTSIVTCTTQISLITAFHVIWWLLPCPRLQHIKSTCHSDRLILLVTFCTFFQCVPKFSSFILHVSSHHYITWGCRLCTAAVPGFQCLPAVLINYKPNHLLFSFSENSLLQSLETIS